MTLTSTNDKKIIQKDLDIYFFGWDFAEFLDIEKFNVENWKVK